MLKKTVKIDILRGLLDGPIAAASQTLALLILLKGVLPNSPSPHEDFLQSVLFGGAFLGMASSMFFLYLGSKLQLSKKLLVALPTFSSAFFFFMAFLNSGDSIIYTLTMMLGFFSMTVRLPILTSIYHEIYPESVRGKYTGWSLMAYQVGTVIFVTVAGEVLDVDFSLYPYVILCLSITNILSGLMALNYPTQEKTQMKYNPFSAFKWIYKDRTFGYILAVWFLFGFANLWIIPLKVKYATIELALSPWIIAFTLGTLPEVTRFAFLPFWAHLFDRINFVVLRMLLNSFLAFGVLVFFFAESGWGIALGSFLHAVGFAGGRLAWSLWVTKLAPEDRSAQYMAIHASLTGIRGVFGPMIGFAFFGLVNTDGDGYQIMGIISFAMITLSILLLAPARKYL